MRFNIPTKIIVHHTAVSRKKNDRQFLAVNRYHKETMGAYCLSDMGYYGGYHIFIEPDGSEWRYRRDNEEGCHTVGENIRSLSICLGLNGDVEFPTRAQEHTLAMRIRKWRARYQIESVDIKPHRKYADKTCYGAKIGDGWARSLVENVPPSVGQMDLEDKKEKLDRLKQLLLRLQILLKKLNGKSKN